ncbi:MULTISPECIES: hypothetical protein [unclassified Halomonas]|uniref:hypothetical protein n=1 Tax=unclassified Halomonas TaxID=2609666 RepID=UPI0007D9A7EC|nr:MULTISPECIES: hypothetical protein [unclassified Halomonas]MBT2784807.1 hypothetical protein [Halomonas sp. ISL-106]MBT2796501.1 hypothetical protein [Halomonas sp. ISL-104]OAL59747.1 hypothetical protein A6R74_00265 [Halomonas sp. ALS9]
MSLESQITALVNAANNLTSEVANKVKGIDAAVLAAVKAIPNLSKDFYVSPDGSDGNAGTFESPLLTVGEAVARTPESGSCSIHLKPGAIHEFGDERQFFGVKNITLRTPDMLNDAKATVYFKTFISSDGGSEVLGLRCSHSCRLSLFNVNVVTPSLEAGTTYYRPSPNGILAHNHFSGDGRELLISLYRSKAEVKDHPLVSSSGFLSVALANSQVDVAALAGFVFNASTYNISRTATTVTGVNSFSDLFKDLDSVAPNYVSNTTI